MASPCPCIHKMGMSHRWQLAQQMALGVLDRWLYLRHKQFLQGTRAYSRMCHRSPHPWLAQGMVRDSLDRSCLRMVTSDIAFHIHKLSNCPHLWLVQFLVRDLLDRSCWHMVMKGTRAHIRTCHKSSHLQLAQGMVRDLLDRSCLRMHLQDMESFDIDTSCNRRNRSQSLRYNRHRNYKLRPQDHKLEVLHFHHQFAPSGTPRPCT